MIIKKLFHKKYILLIICLFIFAISSAQAEEYVNFCKVFNPKKGIEYETHTKITKKFCEYYLKICNEKYNNKCHAKMNAYQGLYNTNSSLAYMHVAYRKDFDKD
jgi:hypothetical protein